MATSLDNQSTFSRFSNLYPELRNHVWHEALPELLSPALYYYTAGLWRPRHLIEGDDEYDPVNNEHNLTLEFRHELLERGSQIEVPLFFVNREARSIALAWIRKQGIKIRFHKDEKQYHFVRPFDPKRDALYVENDMFDFEKFLSEPIDRGFEPDLYEKTVSMGSDITNIAMSYDIFLGEFEYLREMFRDYYGVRVLYIIINSEPQVSSLNNDGKAQQRFHLESTRGCVYIWNVEKITFEIGNPVHMRHPTFDVDIERLNETLGKGLTEAHMRHFEIRPVIAVAG